MLNIGYPLITTAYISRILLPSGVGKISLVQTFISYFTTFAAMGIPNFGIKLIAANQEDVKGRSQAFSELFAINFFSTIITILLFFLFRPLLLIKVDKTLLMIFSTQILFNIINIDWFYQGIEEYGYIAIRNTFVKFSSLGLMLIFVKTSKDYISYAIIVCCATFGNYVFNIFNVRKYISFSIRIRTALKKHMTKVLILFTSVCATEIYTMLDSTMIGVMCSEEELGYYANSIKLIRVIFSFISAICVVYFPRISYLYSNQKKIEYNKLSDQVLKIALYFSIPAMIGIISLSEEIVAVLFGDEFKPSIITIRILSPLIVIFSVAYVSGHIILISVNKEKDIMFATIIGTISNIILNLFLIYLLGYNGAGVATLLTELIVTVCLCMHSCKYVRRNINKQYIISILLANIFMLTVVCIIKFLITTALVRLIISVLFGSIIFFAITIKTKNEISIKIKEHIGVFINKIIKKLS